MRIVCILAFALLLSLRADTVKESPQALELANGQIDIILLDPVPDHWAISVVSIGDKDSPSKMTAGSVQLDGLRITGVQDLDRKRLGLKPGLARIHGVPDEAGLVACVTVPAGTHVHVFHEGSLIAASTSGMTILDGKLEIFSNPKFCDSMLLIQQAIFGEIPDRSKIKP